VDKTALLYRDHQHLNRIKALNDPNSDLFAPSSVPETAPVDKMPKSQQCNTQKPTLPLAALLRKAVESTSADASPAASPVTARPAPTRPLLALPAHIEELTVGNQSTMTPVSKKEATAPKIDGNGQQGPDICVSIFESSSEDEEPPKANNDRSRKGKWQREVWTTEHGNRG